MIRHLSIVLIFLATSSAIGIDASAVGKKRKQTNPKDNPVRWSKAIAAFEQSDAKNPPPKKAILFVGSSSIRLWKLDESFPKLKTINRGFGGSQIADSVYYVRQLVLKHEPRIVVLYAGDNDVARGKSPERVQKDFRAFVKAVHAGLPETRVLFVAIKPSIKRWNLAEKMLRANTLIAADCKRNERLQYIDIYQPMLGKGGKPRPELFAKDGLHLNPAGYKLWASVLRPYLR